MLRRILIVVSIVLVTFLSLNGCKKSQKESEQVKTTDIQKEPEIKTMNDYYDQAKSEINADNMVQELDKIEKEVDQEMSLEQ